MTPQMTPEHDVAAATVDPHTQHVKLSRVLCLDGRRFCRACRTTLPVEAFPAGNRRYLCNKHMWVLVNEPSKQRALADPHKKLLTVLWKRCWDDAKTTFGQARIALRQRDIAEVLSGLDFRKSMSQSSDRSGSRDRSRDTSNILAIALMPADPTQPLSHENLTVVGNDARPSLLRAFRDGGVEQYVAGLRESN